LAEMETLRTGSEPPRPDDPGAAVRARLPLAASRDADLFRSLMEIVGCLTEPAEVFGRPGVTDRVLALTESVELPQPPGPARAELLKLLS
jgi:hypothetical protein